MVTKMGILNCALDGNSWGLGVGLAQRQFKLPPLGL